MGTNYYLHTNICECCKRHDSLHIGKSSAGWPFLFQGSGDYDEPEIRSYAQWRELMVQPGAKIVTEYGEEITFTEFEELVAAKQEYIKSRSHVNITPEQAGRWYNAVDHAKHNWLDEQGYEFSDNDFS